MTQIAVWCPPELSGGWKSPAAKPMAATKSTPFATQLAVDAMAPELSAVAGSYPWRWKNRTRTANAATNLPWTCRARSRLSRSSAQTLGEDRSACITQPR